MKRLLNQKKVAEYELWEKEHRDMVDEEEREFFELPSHQSNDKLTTLITPPATLEMWNQDPIDTSTPMLGHDGFFANSSRWIGR